MNEPELRAYAVRGLTSRLAELDGERLHIQTLLAQWTGEPASASDRQRRPMSDEARRRIGEAARKRWSARRAAAADSTAPGPVEAGADTARVLPGRKKAAGRPDAQPPGPALPPMPRLIKKAS